MSALSALGDVSSYTGEVDAGYFTDLLRTHGADSPTLRRRRIASKAVSCLPFLCINSNVCSEIELDDEGWRGLMVDCGYEVIEKWRALSSGIILNFKGLHGKTTMHGGKTLQVPWNDQKGNSATHQTTKAWVLSSCGTFQSRTIYKTILAKHYGGEWHFVFPYWFQNSPNTTGSALIQWRGCSVNKCAYQRPNKPLLYQFRNASEASRSETPSVDDA